MKRIIAVLAVMAVMAAMLVASAMPAFAAVKTTETGNFDDCRTANGKVCTRTVTTVGGAKDSEFNGKSTSDYELNGAIVPAQRSYTKIESTQGGGKDTGGGNCTEETDFYYPSNSTPISGHGSRCNPEE